jgi:hypothetical protein
MPDINNSGYCVKSLTIFIREVSGWNVSVAWKFAEAVFQLKVSVQL